MAASAIVIALTALVLLPDGGLANDVTKERLIRRVKREGEAEEVEGEIRIGSKGDMIRKERKQESSLSTIETEHDGQETTQACDDIFYAYEDADGTGHKCPTEDGDYNVAALTSDECKEYAEDYAGGELSFTELQVATSPCGAQPILASLGFPTGTLTNTAPMGCFQYIHNPGTAQESKHVYFNTCDEETATGVEMDSAFVPICRRPKYKDGTAGADGDRDGGCPDGYKAINDEDDCHDETACLSEPEVTGSTQDQFRKGVLVDLEKYQYPCGCFHVMVGTTKKVGSNKRKCTEEPAQEVVMSDSVIAPICEADTTWTPVAPTTTTTTTTSDEES